jgi:hypothetical protein
MMKITVGIVALAALLAGCAHQTPQPVPTVTVTAPAPVSEPSASESATPKPSEEPTEEAESTEDDAKSKSDRTTPAKLKLGQTWDNGVVAVTLLKVDRRTKTTMEDETFGGALIKTCVVGLEDDWVGISLNWSPWYLVGPDSEQYSPTSWRNIKMPDYPDDPDQAYVIGDCAKGWVIFESGGAKIDSVSYRPATGETASWTVN